MRVEVLRLKEATGRSASSSSLCTGDGGLSGMVEVSEMKERWEMGWVGLWGAAAKRACLAWSMGEDSGRLWVFFHEAWRDETRVRRPVAAPDETVFCMPAGRMRLRLWLLPERM